MRGIKRERLRLGLTQAQFGKLIGFKATTINDIEHGRCNPTVPKAIRIAKMLGKSVEELFGDENDEETATFESA